MLELSVVIPCRNEAKYMSRCLESILENGYDTSRFEVLVCDGMSDDGTRDIVAQYSEKYAKDTTIRLLDNPNRTVPYALNVAIRAALAPIILRMDAHSIMDAGYIEHCLAALAAHPEAANVGGVFVNQYDTPEGRAIAAAMSSRFGVGNAGFRLAEADGYTDTVPYGCFRREVFDKVGLFDEQLTRNQDDELNFRIIEAGYKIWLDRRIRVLYYVRGDYARLWRQYYQYGYWKVFVNRKHHTITSARQLAPAVWVAGLVVGAGLSLASSALCLVYAMAIFTYAAATLYGAFRAANPHTDTLRVWQAFAVLHLSYGAGYWRGIWDFLIRRRRFATQSGQAFNR